MQKKDPEAIELQDSRSGFFFISNAVESYKLSWKAWLVYLAIAARVRNHSATCLETIAGLAKFSGIGRTTAKEGLKELEQKRVIRVRRRRQKNPDKGFNQQLPSEYILIDLKPVRATSALPEE